MIGPDHPWRRRLSPAQIRAMWMRVSPASWPREEPRGNEGAYADILARARDSGRIEVWDGDMPAAASDDSYQAFARRNWQMCLSDEAESRSQRASEAGLKRWQKTRAAVQQGAWEEEQRQRQQVREDRSAGEWQRELERREHERQQMVNARVYWARWFPGSAGIELVKVRIAAACRVEIAGGAFEFAGGSRYRVPLPVARFLMLEQAAVRADVPEGRA